MENWKQVEGFPRYWISDRGRMMSLPSTRWSATVEQGPGPRLMRIRTDWCGYPIVAISRGGRMRREKFSRTVHRLVLETFRGPCPDGMEARHLNGIKTDNRLVNLEWSTHAENMRDKIFHEHHPGQVR